MQSVEIQGSFMAMTSLVSYKSADEVSNKDITYVTSIILYKYNFKI